MRIISGNLRGRILVKPKNNLTRPLKDMTKESIFNILEHSKILNFDIKNSKILDVFSGSGSFGIECLSRGAKKVFFIENYQVALDVLNTNINKLDLIRKTSLIKKDFFNVSSLNLDKNIFDLIFFDPPFKYSRVNELLTNALKNNFLGKKTIIILHRHKKSKDNIPEIFEELEKKNYGISKIYFFRLRQ